MANVVAERSCRYLDNLMATIHVDTVALAQLALKVVCLKGQIIVHGYPNYLLIVSASFTNHVRLSKCTHNNAIHTQYYIQ